MFPARSVYVWVGAFGLIFLFALAYYFISIPILSVMEAIQGQFPNYFDSDVHELVTNIWLWLPIIMLLGGVLLWVYVNSQKPREMIYA